MLERPVKHKHFSLFGQFITYDEKSFVNTALGLTWKLLTGLKRLAWGNTLAYLSEESVTNKKVL